MLANIVFTPEMVRQKTGAVAGERQTSRTYVCWVHLVLTGN